ncbi:MFS transporter [Amycolatopsis taiwanensis]|uniref:MFS transporter n=1 Tax=Amycolatopsis taiwanensis TaxID=342230 RepID=A0A9W6RA29_9PSEU|nr:MFS transporter [Amycolatopsis taiwanensis]GLY70995.1 MFS transporter [Amycolatopsis taiwanensis]
MACATLTPRSTDTRAERIGFGARFVSAVSIGSLLNPINSSIIAIALVAIGHTFAAGSDRTAWLVSALYLATAIGQPTMGRLADRLGPRRVYLSGAVLVIVGGVLGYVSPSLGVLVVARVVIGLGTSAAYPAAMALIRRQSTRLRQPAPSGVLSSLAIAGQVSMAVGPTLGGLLVMLGGWRFTFLVNVPLGLLSALLAMVWLPSDERGERGEQHEPLWRAIDPPGVALFAGALTALLVFLMDLARPQWWLLALAVVLFAALAGWELRAATPFVDVRMLVHNRGLTTTYLRYGLTMLVTYCFVYGWAIWLEQGAGRSASAAGLLMTPSFAVATVVSLVAARPRRVWGLLVAGAATLTAGSASLLVVHGNAPTWQLLGIGLVFGVQNGLTVAPNQTALYAQAPAEQTGVAAGLMRSFMYVGAIASASLIGLTFGDTATDHGLHSLGAVLTVGSAALLVSTLIDKTLRTGK